MQQAGVQIENFWKRQSRPVIVRNMIGAWAKIIEKTKPKKNRMQHRIITGSGTEKLREADAQNSSRRQPHVSGDQTDRHETRQAGLPGALPCQVITQQPQRQQKQPDSG